MKAQHKVFAEYDYQDSDHSEIAQRLAVEDFLSELGPERVIAITQTKLTIIVWYWSIAQERKIRNDIDRGSKIRILNIPTFLPTTPPRKGEAMCGIK